MIGVEEDVERISDLVRRLEKEHPRAGIKGFVVPIAERI